MSDIEDLPRRSPICGWENDADGAYINRDDAIRLCDALQATIDQQAAQIQVMNKRFDDLSVNAARLHRHAEVFGNKLPQYFDTREFFVPGTDPFWLIMPNGEPESGVGVLMFRNKNKWVYKSHFHADIFFTSYEAAVVWKGENDAISD